MSTENNRREASPFAYDPRIQKLLTKYEVDQDNVLMEFGKNIDQLGKDLGISAATRALLVALGAFYAIIHNTTNSPKESLHFGDIIPTVVEVMKEIKQQAQQENIDIKAEIILADNYLDRSKASQKHLQFEEHEMIPPDTLDYQIEPFQYAIHLAEKFL